MRADHKRFFLQQRHFEEGKNIDHLLAVIVWSQQDSSMIMAIKDKLGELKYKTVEILDCFIAFYAGLYRTKISFAR